jgi:hypothetical protein
VAAVQLATRYHWLKAQMEDRVAVVAQTQARLLLEDQGDLGTRQ